MKGYPSRDMRGTVAGNNGEQNFVLQIHIFMTKKSKLTGIWNLR